VSLVDQRITVVGGGVSGLAASLFAAERGARVELLDEGASLGGLLSPHVFRGVSCDLGSHRLHREALSHPAVARVLGDACLERRPRRGVLLLDGRRIEYPPSFVDVARGLGLTGVGFAASYLARHDVFRRWESARLDAHPEDVGFAEFVRRRVGRALFESFYRPYVEKVWGLDADEVSQTVAKARVSTTSPLRLVGGKLLRLLRGARGGQHEDEFLYPRGGTSTLIAELAQQASARGVTIRTGVRFSGTSTTDRVLFAGRLRALVDRPLHHRGLYLVYVALPIARLSRHETYYTPEARWWFGRVSELQNYSPALRRDGETILCVEIPEGRHGDARRFDEEPLRTELLQQLRDARILPPGIAPIAVEQRFVADVYPLYRRGWTETWEAAVAEASQREVLPFGRQGLFLHCNIDHCIAMAHDVVEHLHAGGDATTWRGRARAMIGVRVRD
jgi:glycine/D-amino acid oxidase-like deaminating enzyme